MNDARCGRQARFGRLGRLALAVVTISGWAILDAPEADAQRLLQRIGARLRGAAPAPAPVYRVPARPNVYTPPADPYRSNLGVADRSGGGATRVSPRGVEGGDDRMPAARPVPAAASASSGTLGIEAGQMADRSLGVQIVRFLPRSAAPAAGLRVGDLIVGVDGRPVRTIDDLASRLESSRPGETVSLRIVRDRIAYDAKVPLIAAAAGVTQAGGQTERSPSESPRTAAKPAGDAAGSDAIAAAGLELRRPEAGGPRGLLVSAVSPESAAAAAGIRPGDRIVSLGGRFVGDIDALERQLSQTDPLRATPVQVVRQGQLIAATLGGDAAKAAADASPDQPRRPAAAGGLLGGIGNVFGGIFAKPDTGAAAGDSAGRSGQSPVEGELPPPVEKSAKEQVTAPDEMALDDDEPIESEVFASPLPPERDLSE